MTIQEKLAILREKMKENNMDIYMIPTADFHQSEYVGEYFKARSYMSGFTGSAGTLVVTLTEAGLWTDGRYFIQAEQQLAGSTITLYRMSEEGVPTVKEFVEGKLTGGQEKVYGLKEDGVGIPETTKNLVPQDIIDYVNSMIEKIKNDEIKVPSNEEEYKSMQK